MNPATARVASARVLQHRAKTLMRSLLGETGYHLLKHNADAFRYEWMRNLIRERGRLIRRPTCPDDLDILLDPEFQKSFDECCRFTKMETSRLANLWSLCRMSNEHGTIVDLGAYKGGTTLHLSNARPRSRIFACDTFDGYGALPLDNGLDGRFKKYVWDDTSPAEIERVFAGKGRDLRILEGYFPDSDTKGEVRDVSFAHLDINLYSSCRNALEYLCTRTTERPIFVLDDYCRSAEGMVRATQEFVSAHPDWCAFPIYPGQGVLMHASWFRTGANVPKESTAVL